MFPGPYRFREYRRHVNITWHHHNETLAYRTLRRWWFDPSSNGTLEDNITTLNVIAAVGIFKNVTLYGTSMQHLLGSSWYKRHHLDWGGSEYDLDFQGVC